MISIPEENYLWISGLQHFSFCRRQWALIHLEQQWAENLRTVEGQLLHQRAHDETQIERRGDLLIVRGMRVVSHTSHIQGVCDVVEFHRSPDGVSLYGYEDTWLPYPVEYKKGKPNAFGADELQLCAQAMCLEEMLACHIPEGSLFYGEPRRRSKISLDQALRQKVQDMLLEMQDLYVKRYTPKAKPTKSCSACSLKNLCLPRLSKISSVSDYLQAHLPEKETL